MREATFKIMDALPESEAAMERLREEKKPLVLCIHEDIPSLVSVIEHMDFKMFKENDCVIMNNFMLHFDSEGIRIYHRDENSEVREVRIS